MTGYYFALGLIVVLLVLVITLMRRRRLREKYAAIWLVVAIGVCVIGAFPSLVTSLANVVGVETPSNLLFAVAILVLLMVCIQLSVEASTLEEEVRTVAEQLALLQQQVESHHETHRKTENDKED